jgi:mannose-6-phosphate isomerase-like protein (cupin superfamily)
MKRLSPALFVVLAAVAAVSAQTTTPPAAPAPAPPRTQPRATNTTSTTGILAVQVTDKSGNGIGNVAVAVSGPVERSGQTAADGSVSFRSMRAGTYRLRFEHERFITLEREVMMTRGAEVAVALNPAPPKPVALPPPPPPAAVAEPAEQRKLRAVEPRQLSIPDFVERNLIGSEPQKTSLLACTDGGGARILQVKEPLNNQSNETADQLLYVVAGAGVVRVRDQTYKADPGWFVLIPRGVQHSIRREGRNPLIALTVAMGNPCTETGPMAR